jgi:hypothetical protein
MSLVNVLNALFLLLIAIGLLFQARSDKHDSQSTGGIYSRFFGNRAGKWLSKLSSSVILVMAILMIVASFFIIIQEIYWFIFTASSPSYDNANVTQVIVCKIASMGA